LEPHHPNWPRISSALFYDDADGAIAWLSRVFAFEVRLKIEGDAGRIEHSELCYGDGLIMVVSSAAPLDQERKDCVSPRSLAGKNTQSLCVYVNDLDAHFTRAKAEGATILRAPKTDDYGEEHGAHRSYLALDPEGHRWWFMHVVRDPKAA
jgi:uncharacterized glyoxalase superfamily protein PhnB